MSAAEKSSRKLSIYILSIVFAIWFYSLWSDRVTPITTESKVHTYLVRVAPEVSGNIVDVGVKDNQIVEQGDELFKIDPRNYGLALASAQANLALVGQNIGASTAAVEVAQAKVVDALAARNNAREQARRSQRLAERGVVSQSDLDNAIEAEARAQASLEVAQASLVQAKQSLGPTGENNPQILSAMARLEKAELDLRKTQVLAPSRGIVTNMQLTIGQNVAAGSPVLTFIDPRNVWISSLIRENSMEYIRPGQTVKIVLDALPGRVLTGKVESIGWGTGGSNNIDPATGFLNSNQGHSAPQRYPVNIVFDDIEQVSNIRYGSQATVAIFTEQSRFGEYLAGIWMKIVSIWTYVS
ncbi:HlyD family secretion protein [Vibrio europaeus]|uniref:HlyD family secretion protein n=1 Tax=Vibrio oreintalis group TaxID=1891919 RepID=UPI0018A75503|nr:MULTISPECIES: HlyD family secretion protein [Vibrio oreintalis group]MCG9578458.1 HlyD family secretion protein [Vibrio tubiashii]MDC5808769.1 HlyD family secretion protein [Vibrio europaeus]QPG38025.1 HlyD family secretion protein [Vibrio europaeus]